MEESVVGREVGKNLLCQESSKISEMSTQKVKGVWCTRHTRRTTGAG